MKRLLSVVVAVTMVALVGVARAGTLSSAALPFNTGIWCDVVNVNATSTVNTTLKVITTTGATAQSFAVSLAPRQATAISGTGAYCQFVSGSTSSLEGALVYLNANGYAISLPAY